MSDVNPMFPACQIQPSWLKGPLKSSTRHLGARESVGDMRSPCSMRARVATVAPVLLLVALFGRLMFMSSDNFTSAFVPPVTEPRAPSTLRNAQVSAPLASPAAAPIFTAVALAGCFAASLRLVKRPSNSSTKAHLVQLKAEASDKEKEDKEDTEDTEDTEEEEEEEEEDDTEDTEEEEEEEDDLDELVMEDDDDDDDFEEEEEDDDFELGDDDDVVYGEDDMDDSFFTSDEEGNPVEAKCRARFLKGSPWKFRRVLWQIRNRSYREALMLLEFMPWRACRPTLVALQSAASNAQNHFNMDKSRLYVYSCKADRGPTSKRMRPMSKGQPHQYRRRSTHLEIVVREMTDAEMQKRGEYA